MQTAMVKQPLTEEELNERRDKIAVMFHLVGTLEQEKKDVAAEYTKQVKAMNVEICQLAREIREKCEYREAQLTLTDELRKRRATVDAPSSEG